MNDDAFYDEVAKELQSRTMVSGVWTRAFAEADGELDRARALYIKYRVAQLAQARNQHLQEDQRAAFQTASRRTMSGLRRFALALLVVVFGFLTCAFGVETVVLIVAFFPGSIADPINIGVILFFGGITFVLGRVTRACIKATRR
jgi:uncharacterized membrane protein